MLKKMRWIVLKEAISKRFRATFVSDPGKADVVVKTISTSLGWEPLSI